MNVSLIHIDINIFFVLWEIWKSQIFIFSLSESVDLLSYLCFLMVGVHFFFCVCTSIMTTEQDTVGLVTASSLVLLTMSPKAQALNLLSVG